jgi:hypothetical protein
MFNNGVDVLSTFFFKIVIMWSNLSPCLLSKLQIKHQELLKENAIYFSEIHKDYRVTGIQKTASKFMPQL